MRTWELNLKPGLIQGDGRFLDHGYRPTIRLAAALKATVSQAAPSHMRSPNRMWRSSTAMPVEFRTYTPGLLRRTFRARASIPIGQPPFGDGETRAIRRSRDGERHADSARTAAARRAGMYDSRSSARAAHF